jgi:signal transduction histidine kinase
MRYGLYGTVFLWTILSSLEAALSPYHNFYLLRPLISVAIVSFVFLERKWLNGYLLFNFIITSIVSFIMDIPDELEILFLTGFACVTLSVCLLMNTILQLQTQYKSIVISLAEKDKKIEEYAHMNSHVVRAPLARLMGLIRLLGLDLSTHELTDKVQKEATDLDKVIRKAQRLLE